MISAKDQLAHLVDCFSEEEAEKLVAILEKEQYAADAAQELLAACKALLPHVTSELESDTRPFIVAARKAIAKAEGR